MKAILLVHHTFLRGGSADWLRAFAAAAAARDPGVAIFDERRHRLTDFEVAHVFGMGHIELLWNLGGLGLRTVLTPYSGEAPARTAQQRLAAAALWTLQAFAQRRVRPDNQLSRLRAVRSFLLPSGGAERWARDWKIPAAQTVVVPPGPEEAARAALRTYQLLRDAP